MPRLDYHLTLTNTFTRTERVVLLSALQLINDVRDELGLSQLTEMDVIPIVRDVLHAVREQEA